MRAEMVQEIVATTAVAYVRLAELGKEDVAYPTPLVNYAAAMFGAGRRVGSRLNVRDVMSPQCQRKKSVVVETLSRFDGNPDEWQEVLVEDRHASPADLAMIRIDFRAWLKSLPERTRGIAEALASGQPTSDVACMFFVSASRISQLRASLRRSWYTFVGELPAMDCPCQ
jgi:hypothetical protein